MDSQHGIPAARGLGQSPFFYYNPEPGHFTPHPRPESEPSHLQHFQQQMYPADAMVHGQPQMLFARPSSSGAPVYLPPKTAMALQPFNTPVASPRPLNQRPALLSHNDGLPHPLNTDCRSVDLYGYPSTPPLSVSASTVNSPPSTRGVLPTPLAGGRLALDNLEGVKEGCVGEVQTEILASGDWTRCGSPPLTPGMSFQPTLRFTIIREAISGLHETVVEFQLRCCPR